ncbi:hypothetical protein O9G_005762 [Rozella allomycis CSF55]|uniref:Conserved oligomeric Golgi complex subunit 7 n=1 Tax=Rozella allomycis (strain CSF55) TaxID=988480 RepID=A0A075B0G0_ROZAC|nr:hypothetical protein O9G_005762 [Rozella allomycis CSF55]|eukprot:EPZ34444.1 hypothetical protein O9G_005762 [Rozella allomycis CSF55]
MTIENVSWLTTLEALEDLDISAFVSTITKENNITKAQLLETLEYQRQRLTKSIEQSTKHAMQSIPYILTELEISKKKFCDLNTLLSLKKHDISKYQAKEAFDQLLALDNAKTRIRNTREILMEMKKWNNLQQEIEQGLVNRRFDVVCGLVRSAMNTISTVDSIFEDAEERKNMLENSVVKLMRDLETETMMVFEKNDVLAIEKIFGYYQLIERQGEFYRLFVENRSDTVQSLWTRHISLHMSDKNIASHFDEFYGEFYNFLSEDLLVLIRITKSPFDLIKQAVEKGFNKVTPPLDEFIKNLELDKTRLKDIFDIFLINEIFLLKIERFSLENNLEVSFDWGEYFFLCFKSVFNKYSTNEKTKYENSFNFSILSDNVKDIESNLLNIFNEMIETSKLIAGGFLIFQTKKLIEFYLEKIIAKAKQEIKSLKSQKKIQMAQINKVLSFGQMISKIATQMEKRISDELKVMIKTIDAHNSNHRNWIDKIAEKRKVPYENKSHNQSLITLFFLRSLFIDDFKINEEKITESFASLNELVENLLSESTSVMHSYIKLSFLSIMKDYLVNKLSSTISNKISPEISNLGDFIMSLPQLIDNEISEDLLDFYSKYFFNSNHDENSSLFCWIQNLIHYIEQLVIALVLECKKIDETYCTKIVQDINSIFNIEASLEIDPHEDFIYLQKCVTCSLDELKSMKPSSKAEQHISRKILQSRILGLAIN